MNLRHLNLQAFSPDDIIALAAVHAPSPTESTISLLGQSDRNKNPHNDSHKPPLRSREEIIADCKIEFGRMFLQRLERSTGALQS